MRKQSNEKKCLECGAECCKRWHITLLPMEAQRIAKFNGQQLQEFIEKKCILLLQLFPQVNEAELSFSSTFLPRKAIDFFGFTGQEKLLFLPWIALKRFGKKCIFLSNGKCKIYSVKPKQCELFPFISLEAGSLKKKYPYCLLLKGSEKATLDLKHKKAVEYYFHKIALNGFLSVWRFLPSKAIVSFNGKELELNGKNTVIKLIHVLS